MSNETLRTTIESRGAGNPGDLIPVIGYARVSTWREEMISVEIQMRIVEEVAGRRGRYVSEWIVDPDATGRTFKRRVMRAIEIVEDDARAEREVWSWKFSRFGRNRHGVAVNLARIEAVGGELVSATEEIDPRTAVGRFTRGMLLELAAFESDRAGEQWKEAHDLRRSKGLPATGGKRFGYVWHPRRVPDGEGGIRIQEERYEVDPDMAELSLEGIQAFNAGTVGYGKIAMRWNDLGLLNTRGRPWQDQTVRWYYDSGFGAGLLVTHRPEVQCSNPGRCQKPLHFSHLPAEHEAIWSGEEWDAYRERRKARRAVPPRSLNPAYMCSGLIRCGECGGYPVNDKVRENSCYAYQCGARARHAIEHETVWIRRSVVEARVHEWLVGVRDEIDAIAAGTVVVPTPRRAPDTGAGRAVLEAQLGKLAAAIDRATTGHVMGDIPRDSYLRTRDALATERAEVQRKLDALPKESTESAGPAPFRDVVQGLIDEWDTLNVAAKRVILASLIRRVEICPQKTVRVVPAWAPADETPATEPIPS
ncbi:recombinase family protein [Streptomyces racemochromogenes]|uniref:recombinase family protein n=1 Tax=Streptomyces racemochromogenes TaxID=67353 RepID=UPI0031E655CB